MRYNQVASLVAVAGMRRTSAILTERLKCRACQAPPISLFFSNQTEALEEPLANERWAATKIVLTEAHSFSDRESRPSGRQDIKRPGFLVRAALVAPTGWFSY